jgi:WD40 repeat protein
MLVFFILNKVKWSPECKLLFSGGCDAVIHAYDIKKLKEKHRTEGFNPLKKNSKEGHQGQVLDLLTIPKQSRFAFSNNLIYPIGILVSAGMDAQICLWSFKDLEYRHSLKGHVYGIYSLDWSDSTNALFSAGLDHDVYIWNPYVNRRIFVLKGHNHSLVGVKCVPGTPQVISADISGMFRIWDIRTFTTVQVFNCTMNEINCFTVTDQPKRIIAGGKRLHFFDYDEPTDHHLADDQGCIAVLYNKIFYTFITAHPKCIKVWDATNGKLLSVFRDLTTRDITCICMDHRERKVFVGDSKGRVFTINIKNGARMKKFRKHDQDTSCLYYWGDFNRLISCSWDGRVIIHDDSTSAQKGVLRNEFKQHKKSCNYLHFNLKETLLASSSDDRSIILTNLNSYRQEAVLTHHEAEVKVAIFLTDNQSDSQLDYMCLVSADLTGKLYFYAIVPSKIKNTLLTTVTDTIESDVGTPENFPVRAMSFDPQRMMLYTGTNLFLLIYFSY